MVIGGGQAYPVLLKSLRNQSMDITAIVTVADDGGSSGELRESVTTMTPPWRFKKCLSFLIRYATTIC